MNGRDFREKGGRVQKKARDEDAKQEKGTKQERKGKEGVVETGGEEKETGRNGGKQETGGIRGLNQKGFLGLTTRNGRERANAPPAKNTHQTSRVRVWNGEARMSRGGQNTRKSLVLLLPLLLPNARLDCSVQPTTLVVGVRKKQNTKQERGGEGGGGNTQEV